MGGGTAGLTVATRLSQYLPDSSVLVIEAGPDARDVPGIYIPRLSGSTLGSIYDWNFTTVPQQHASDRVIPQNRGHVLGGSSALNLLSYDRGAKADYDAWQELGNPGWDWASMHAAMRKAETYQVTSSPGSEAIAEEGGVGMNGPIHALVNRFNPPQQQQFFPTMQNLGLEQTASFLDGDMLGWMYHTSMIFESNYTRSYSPDYLSRAGPNLRVMTGTMVARIEIDDNHCATGVTLADGSTLRAKKEVILSAGSIQSPQLLELSGIGNPSILSSAGVTPVVDLTGVGENLQDHMRISTAYQLKDNYTSPDELRLNATFAAEQMALYEQGELSWYDETSSGYAYMQWPQAGEDQARFVDLAEQSVDPSSSVDKVKLDHLRDLSKRVPQVEILFSDGYLGGKGYPVQNSSLYGKRFFALIASVNHPFSRGSTHINSSDVMDHPLFDPNYLSTPYDLHAITAAARQLRRIATTPPLSYAWVSEYEPGFDVVSTEQEWAEYARLNFSTIWHPLGTCAMLPKEDGGVVSPELKVYGVDRLRVVDASVVPILVSGHIQTSAYGIAERAAEMIAREWE